MVDGTTGEDSGTIDSGGADGATITPDVDEAGCPTELEQADASGSRIFLTEARSPAFGGVAGANAICQDLGSRKYGGNWHAWISTSACPAFARFVKRERFLAVDGGSVGPMGDNTSPSQPIDNQDLSAWTGTTFEGKGTGVDCAGWTKTASELRGTYGGSRSPSKSWTDRGDLNCAQLARLYCFEL